LLLGVLLILDTALAPYLLDRFAAPYPNISVSVEEVSSTEIETALEEGRTDLGLGFVTRHSPNLCYERLCSDEFALIAPKMHLRWNRQVIDLSEIHQQRLMQLSGSFVAPRMTDEICRNYQVRPRTIAEISGIETLLRSLAPLKGGLLCRKLRC
jgi:DNA-binding transcriptional LysR family regulator